MLTIDKDVPVPRSCTVADSTWTDIAQKMQPGDSVIVQNYNEAQCMRQALHALYADFNRAPGKRKVMTQRLQEDFTIRVWRLY